MYLELQAMSAVLVQNSTSSALKLLLPGHRLDSTGCARPQKVSLVGSEGWVGYILVSGPAVTCTIRASNTIGRLSLARMSANRNEHYPIGDKETPILLPIPQG